MIEVVFTLSDGLSVSATKLYVGHGAPKETVEGLEKFKSQVHGGIYVLEWGGFGLEFASGAVPETTMASSGTRNAAGGSHGSPGGWFASGSSAASSGVATPPRV